MGLQGYLTRHLGWLSPKLIRGAGLVTRPLTLGVRGIVVDERKQVFLVRHGYTPGWHLPGGGVEPGESLPYALAREVGEETGLRVMAPLLLHGIFQQNKRSHVVVYVVRSFVPERVRQPDWEIAEGRFFDVDAFPADTTPATRRRVQEALHGDPPALVW